MMRVLILVNACRIKIRLNPELKHGLGDTAKIITEDFTQCLIDLRGVALAADVAAKLPFNHAES
jgi:hypothetical protein